MTKAQAARTADEAVEVAHHLGYPVVLKIHSPQITHKTDVGGVMLNVGSDEKVRTAFEQITGRAKQKRPDAEIIGVTVQKMVTYPNSFELIMGTKKDPIFGSVIMIGMGGVAAEVFRDRALGLPPLNEALARRMLESLKSWPLLQGYRGKPGANIDRLIEIIMRFSYLVADYPEIKELDINPLAGHARGRHRVGRPRGGRPRSRGAARCVRMPTWPSDRIPRSTSPSGR